MKYSPLSDDVVAYDVDSVLSTACTAPLSIRAVSVCCFLGGLLIFGYFLNLTVIKF